MNPKADAKERAMITCPMLRFIAATLPPTIATICMAPNGTLRRIRDESAPKESRIDGVKRLIPLTSKLLE
jgi:hypothetical protein